MAHLRLCACSCTGSSCRFGLSVGPMMMMMMMMMVVVVVVVVVMVVTVVACVFDVSVQIVACEASTAFSQIARTARGGETDVQVPRKLHS